MRLEELGMTSTKKCVLGNYVELCSNENSDLIYGINDVRGVNNKKQMMPTKANLKGRDLSKFLIVNPGEFVFNRRTSRNGSKFSVAYNDGEFPIICTEDYVVFKIREECKNLLNARWLYMYFNRPEFDRYVITNSWGSATELFHWKDIQAIELEIPSFEIQQKYVDVYNALLANQQSYEQGLEDLKLVCDAYIDELKKRELLKKLGNHISSCEQRNDDLAYGIGAVRGISIEKKFIDTKANMEGVSLKRYAIVNPNEFAYVTVTSRNGEKISLARNNSNKPYLCSSSYVVFKINDTSELLPEYLSILFGRSEFDRYARFNSWGSARETFSWEEMCDLRIPVPKIELQQDIVNIFEAFNIRKEINEKLKEQIKDICPILVKASIDEARQN